MASLPPDMQYELEKRRLTLEEDRLERDNRWVARWAPLIIPGFVTLITAIVTAGITLSTAYSQQQETMRANSALDHQKSIKDAQAAVTMYFDKLGDLRTKETLTPAEGKRFANDLNIVAVLSDYAPVYKLLSAQAADVAKTKLALTQSKGTLQTIFPSQAVQGFPDLVATAPQGQYRPQTFLAFPQVPGPTGQKIIDRLTTTLNAFGFRVQAVQHMAAGLSPKQSDVRFYRPDQKALADATANLLTRTMGTPFRSRLLGTPGLPNGVIEVWLGSG